MKAAHCCQRWKSNRQRGCPALCSLACEEQAVYYPMMQLPLAGGVVAPIVLLVHFQELRLCRVIMRTCDTVNSIISISVNIQAAITVFGWLFSVVSCFSACISCMWKRTHPSRIRVMITFRHTVLILQIMTGDSPQYCRQHLCLTLFPNTSSSSIPIQTNRLDFSFFFFWLLNTCLCRSGRLLRGVAIKIN